MSAKHAMPDPGPHRDDDGEFAALRRNYVGGLRTTVTAVKEAVASRDREIVRTLAHQTRGAAGMYGYPELSITAGLLEDAIAEGRGEALIRALVDEFVRGMQAIASANPGGAPCETPGALHPRSSRRDR